MAEVNELLFEISKKMRKKTIMVHRINGICNSNFSNEMKITFRSGGDKNDDSEEEKSPSHVAEGVKYLDGKEPSLSSMRVSVEGMPCAKSKESQIFYTEKTPYVEDNAINGGVAMLWKDMKCENDEVIISSPGYDIEDDSSRKRKRESMIGLLNWVTKVAKNPNNLAIGLVPKRSKWKSYGTETEWKQVLLVRKEMYLQRHLDSSGERSAWQKNQRMHPSMYVNQSPDYNFRERLRCTNGSSFDKTTSRNKAVLVSPSSRTPCDLDKNPRNMLETGEFASKSKVGINDFLSPYLGDNHVREHILVGSRYQANIPVWDNEMFEIESKWLGTRVWPLEKEKNKFLIERDRIGKGRMDSCGCQVPDSPDCVKFHIVEKRSRLKLELCSAFDQWEFNKMGEKVSTYWKANEEKKFRNTVRLNPLSLGKFFWDEIFKFFPKKSRADLVSYYFNVFLLQCREYQNRFSLDNISSDDDELEFTLRSQFPRKDRKTSPSHSKRSPSN